MEKVTLKQYAEIHGVNLRVLQGKVLHGDFQTAEKVGMIWFISADEEYVDKRVKSGKYRKCRRQRDV